MKPTRSLVLAVFALCCLAAPTTLVSCSENTSQSSSFSFTDLQGGGTIMTMGVTIKIEDSVRYRSETQSSTTDGSTTSSSSTTLNGHPFGLEGGTFFIGDTTYGDVEEGSVIRVSDEGVFVNEELRGPVPAQRDEAESE